MDKIKNDRILKNSILAFVVLISLFGVFVLIGKYRQTDIIVIKQFFEYIPNCIVSAAASFFLLSLVRVFYKKSSTRIFYYIMLLIFAAALFDKVIFIGDQSSYDIFRVISGICGLFVAMVIYDRICDTDINKKKFSECKNALN